MVIKAALVGYGAVAQKGHLPWYQRKAAVELTAVVDPTERGRAVARHTLPDAAVFSRIEELLDSKQVDFIDITAPPAAHITLLRPTILAGIPVICEKPFVLSSLELREVSTYRNLERSIIAACHNWYYAPPFYQGLRIVHSGIIGDVRKVVFVAHRPGPSIGADNWNPVWRIHGSAGGGIIGDLGCHGFYLASRIFGKPPYVVTARSSQWSPDQDSAEISGVLELDYGLQQRATISLDWTSAERTTMLEVQGTLGAVVMTMESVMVAVGDEQRPMERFASLSNDSWHAAWIGDTLDAFLEVVQGGDRASSWRDVCWNVPTLHAAYTSVRSGAPVKVELPSDP